MPRAAPESRQQARTIAYSLARALRALAGGLTWERFTHAPCVEMLARVADSASFGLMWGRFGRICAWFGARFGLIRVRFGADS